MANSVLTITAPSDLIEATIAAYAAESSEIDHATATAEETKAAAIEAMLNGFRQKVVAHLDQADAIAARQAQRAASIARHEAMEARRDEINVTITPAQ